MKNAGNMARLIMKSELRILKCETNTDKKMLMLKLRGTQSVTLSIKKLSLWGEKKNCLEGKKWEFFVYSYETMNFTEDIWQGYALIIDFFYMMRCEVDGEGEGNFGKKMKRKIRKIIWRKFKGKWKKFRKILLRILKIKKNNFRFKFGIKSLSKLGELLAHLNNWQNYEKAPLNLNLKIIQN